MIRSRSQRGFGRNPRPLILDMVRRPDLFGRVGLELHGAFTDVITPEGYNWLSARAHIASLRFLPIRFRLREDGTTIVSLELFEEDLLHLRHLLCEWDE